MSIEQKIIYSGIGFLVTVIAGVWLSISGRPYNTGIFTVHKLIALVAVILMGILMVNLFKGAEIETLFIILLITGIISVLALFVTGALMSAGSIQHLLGRVIHIIASISAFTSIGLSIFLMYKKLK